ncbi:hypothetical protein HK405_014483, partial [Cladochytrium tenue]
MYTLLSGLYELYSRKDDFYILILGLDSAGKTTLLERIKATYTGLRPIPPDKIGPTVGLNISRVEVGRVRLNFWDLGGQPGLRGLWDKYFAEAHAVVFVVDASDEGRVEEAKEAFGRVIAARELDGVPLLVLANKADRPAAVSAQGMRLILADLAVGLGARDSKVLGVSALRG